MKKLNLICLFLLLVGFSVVNAQDKIFKRDGKILDVKVTEVGLAEVKYRVPKDSIGPIYTLEKSKILKIVYAGGREETFRSDLSDPELYADQKKNALKINFIAPLLGFTQFNFEHNLRPGKSYELSLGLIGLGNTSQSKLYYNRRPRGAFMGAGYKFSKLPDFITHSEKYSHVLQGQYLKTELIFGVYGQDIQDLNGDFYRKSTIFGAFMLNFGKQWVLGNQIIVDSYVGVGYAFDNLNDTEDYAFHANHFALSATGDSGIGLTGGLKIGLLLNRHHK